MGYFVTIPVQETDFLLYYVYIYSPMLFWSFVYAISFWLIVVQAAVDADDAIAASQGGQSSWPAESSRVIFGLSSYKFMAQLSFPMEANPLLNRPDLMAFYPIMLEPYEQPLARLVIATVDVFAAN